MNLVPAPLFADLFPRAGIPARLAIKHGLNDSTVRQSEKPDRLHVPPHRFGLPQLSELGLPKFGLAIARFYPVPIPGLSVFANR